MKKFMKVLSLVLALGLILGLTVTSNAAETVKISAAMVDEIEDAIWDAAGADVEVTLTADIEDTLYLYPEEGQTVTIKGNYTMRGLYIYGEGTVSVDVKEIVSDINNCALYAYDSVTVKINADLSTEEGTEYGADVVCAYDNAVVEITGNVTAGTARYSSAGNGINADDNASVTVIGNVTGGNAVSPDPENEYADGGDGIDAEGNAKVKVTGNVTAGTSNGYYAYAANGITVSDDASVEVIGNVTGGYATELNGYTYDSEEILYGQGHGIFVSNYDGGSPTVKVTGNITGGKAPDSDSLGGCGICIDDEWSDVSASVTVIGDVTGGDGAGIVTPASPDVEIYVSGTVSGSKDEVAIEYLSNDGDVPDFTQMPTYAEIKAEDPAFTYKDYISILVSGINYMGEEGLITDEQTVDFLLTVLDPLFKLVGVTLPQPLDTENEQHQQVVQEGMTKLEALADTSTGEAQMMAALEANDAKIYGKFIEIASSVGTDPLTAPQITVWALTPNADGELTNRKGYLPTVKYLVKIADTVGGTVTATKNAISGMEMTIFTVTPDADYDLESFSVNNGKLTGGKIAWNCYVDNDYTGGILATATFKNVAPVNPGAPSVTPPAGETNPPTSDSDTMVFAALAAMTAAMGFCLINLVRIRRNEQ